MNYDEHEATSDPGPIASQNWFVANLTRVLKVVPKEKLICALGNYGYDWTLSIPPAVKARPQAAKAAGAQHRWICLSRTRGSGRRMRTPI